MPDQRRTRSQTRPNVNLGPDIAGTNQAPLPSTQQRSEPKKGAAGHAPELDRATGSQTRSSTAGVSIPADMRNMLNRLNRIDQPGDISDAEARRLAGLDTDGTEPTTTQNLPALTRTEVARISREVMAGSSVNPKWHSIKNLPGFQDRKVRGMGQDIFSMFTRTAHHDIQTIASVGGRGPNSEQEIKGVLAWLKKNAEALPESHIDFGQGLPGYAPKVREFRTKNTRFHVVNDPAGWYIYAYPEQDAVTHSNADQLGYDGNDSDENERDEFGALIPKKLTQKESKMKFNSVSEQIRHIANRLDNLAEQATLDEVSLELLESVMLDESTLAKLLGKTPGARELVHALHSRHKLASGGLKNRPGWSKNVEPNYELVPDRLHAQSIKASKDNFAIIVGAKGVAGVKPLESDWDASKSKERDNTMRYTVVWSTGNGDVDHEVHKYRLGRRDATGGYSGLEGGAPNLFQVLQDRIGPTVDVYRAVGAVERGKMQQRKDIAATSKPNIEQIGNKIKPVLMKLLQGTVGQLGPRIQKLANAGNYTAVEKLTRAGKKLQDMLAALDTPNPEWTGWRSPLSAYGDIIRQGVDELTQGMDAAGKEQFMSNIAQGQARELGQLLDYIRSKLFTIS